MVKVVQRRDSLRRPNLINDEPKATEVISRLKRRIDGGKGSLKSVNEALWFASKLCDWRLAMDLFALAKLSANEGKIRPLSSAIFSRTLLILVTSGGSGADALQLVCESLEHGHILSDTVVTSIMIELGKRGEVPSMLAILDQLSRYEGITVSNMAMMALLVGCDRSKQYDKMLELYHTRMQPRMLDWVAVGLLLKACEHQRRAETAIEVIEAVLDAHVLDDEFFSAMPESVIERVMAILVREGEGEHAVRLVLQVELMRADAANTSSDEEQEQEQEQLGSFTDMEYLNIIQRLLDVSKSTEIGPDQGMMVDIDSLDVVERATLHLIEGGHEDTQDCTNFADMENGTNLQEEAEHSRENTTVIGALLDMSHPPACSPRVYCGVLSALARCGRAQDCRNVLQSYKSRGGTMLEEMYTSAITAFRYSRDCGAAWEVFEELKDDESVCTSIASYNALLLVHAVAGTLAGSEKQDYLLAEIKRASLALNRESFTALIMGQNSTLARVALWEEMLGADILPTIASAEEVLKVSDGDTALRVLDYLMSLPPQVRSIKGNDESIPRGIQRRHALGADPIQWKQAKASAVRIRPRRKIESLSPTVGTVLLVIQALAAEGRSQEILEVIARARERHVEPNFKCYMAAIRAFDANNDDWQSAVKLLIQMQGKGMRNGLTRALKAALQTCFRKERYELIKKLVDQARMNPRFLSNTPLEVQEVALVTAFKMRNEEWAADLAAPGTGGGAVLVRGQMAQAVRGKEGEEQDFRDFARRAGYNVEFVD